MSRFSSRIFTLIHILTTTKHTHTHTHTHTFCICWHLGWAYFGPWSFGTLQSHPWPSFDASPESLGFPCFQIVPDVPRKITARNGGPWIKKRTNTDKKRIRWILQNMPIFEEHKRKEKSKNKSQQSSEIDTEKVPRPGSLLGSSKWVGQREGQRDDVSRTWQILPVWTYSQPVPPVKAWEDSL